MRLLLAEDDVDLAEVLAASLRQSGHGVDWVVSGTEAERMLQSDEFDLIPCAACAAASSRCRC